MKKSTIGRIFGMIALTTLAIFGGIFAYQGRHEIAYTYYEGNLVLQTEQDYVTFKQALADPQISSWDATVLSSEPPILVKFTATAPKDFYFPYGERHEVLLGASGVEPYTMGYLFMLVFGCMFCILLAFKMV